MDQKIVDQLHDRFVELGFDSSDAGFAFGEFHSQGDWVMVCMTFDKLKIGFIPPQFPFSEALKLKDK